MRTHGLLATTLLLIACGESSFEPGKPATLEVHGTMPGAATAGSAVSPAVRVLDEDGRPVRGAVVTFEVTAGGGSVSSASVTTNSNGVAALSAWTLGGGLVENSLVARLEALPPVTFSVWGCSTYCIDIRFGGTVTPAQRAAFMNARQRWEQVITGDLSPVPFNAPANVCRDEDDEIIVETPALDEVIDDLVVYVQVGSIDGAGSVLASAGPCFIRNSNRLPVFGVMLLDEADVLVLEQNDRLDGVILHELGHVLGFPTIWEDAVFALLAGKGGADPHFIGAAAATAFTAAGGTLVNGVGVPVENTGGAGTRDSHWRENVLGNELMTGFIAQGSNPLSAITIASFQDIGYQVDMSAADVYAVPGASALHAAGSSALTEIVERRMAPPRTVH